MVRVLVALLAASGSAFAMDARAETRTPGAPDTSAAALLWRTGTRPFGHGGNVTAIAISPGGARVVTSGAGNTLQAWTRAGAPRWQHRVPSALRDLASLDDRTVVQARDDRLTFVDTQTGLPLREVEHRGARAPLASAEGGSRLAFRLLPDSAVQVTDARGVAVWRAAIPARGDVAAIALSPDGETLAVASGTSVLVFARGGGQPGHVLAHTARVTDVVFVDAVRVATAWNTRAIAVWDVRAGAREREVTLNHDVRVLAGHPGKRLLAAARFRGFTVWDGARTIEVEAATPATLAFSRDGATLAIGTGDYDVRLFDTASWRTQTQAGAFAIPSSLAIDEARGEVLVGTFAGRVLRFSLRDGAPTEPEGALLKRDGWTPGVRALALARSGRGIACPTDGRAQMIAFGAAPAVLLAGDATCRDVQPHPGRAQAVVTLGEGGALHEVTLDAPQPGVARKLADTLPLARALAVDPKGRYVAVSGRSAEFGLNDGALAIHALASGKRLALHVHDGDSVRALAFTRDGRTVLAAIGDDGLRAYALPSGKLTRRGKHRCEGLDQLAMGPRGVVLAASTWSGRLCFFDPRTLTERQGFDVSVSGLRALAFTRDGRTLVTLARDGVVSAWRAPMGLPPERPAKEVVTAATEPPPKTVRNRDGAVVWSTIFDRVGTLSGARTWRAICAGGYCQLTRETSEVREAVYVKEQDVEDVPVEASGAGGATTSGPDASSPNTRGTDTNAAGASGAPPPQRIDTRGRACAGGGLCAVSIEAGTELPHGLDGAVRITAKQHLRFTRPMRACRIGPIVKLAPAGDIAGWLSPAAFSYRATFNPVMLFARRLRFAEPPADATPVRAAQLPTCDASRQRWRRRTIRAHGGPPRMGLFVLRPADATRVDRARRDAKRGFELARRLAVRRWVYADRDCDDPVRMILLPLGAHDLAAPMIAGGLPKASVDLRHSALRARHWDEIVMLHARMVHGYEPALCDRALRRLSAALRLARARGLRVRHFGY